MLLSRIFQQAVSNVATRHQAAFLLKIGGGQRQELVFTVSRLTSVISPQNLTLISNEGIKVKTNSLSAVLYRRVSGKKTGGNHSL